MSCANTVTAGPQTVWSKSGVAGAVVHPMTDWYDTTGLDSIRPTIEMRQDSSSAKITFCYQYSNSKDPGATWVTTLVTLAAEDVEFGPWIGVAAGQELYIRFGVKAEQESGTVIQMAVASLRVDMR